MKLLCLSATAHTKNAFAAYLAAFILLVAALLISRPALAEPAPSVVLELAADETAAGDQLFIAAREAFRTGNRAKLQSLRNELAAIKHVLTPHTDYYLLQQGLANQDEDTIAAFLTREQNSYLGERLATDWLKVLAKKNRWTEVAQLYTRLQSPDQEAVCVELMFRLRRPGADQEVLFLEAQKPWLTLVDVPEGCQALFAYLGEYLDDEQYWQRARIMTERGKQKAVQQALRALPSKEQPDAKQFTQLWEKPLVWLNRQKQETLLTRTQKEIVALAIARLAANNPDLAVTQLERWQKSIGREAAAWCWGEIALVSARRHRPEALDWFARGQGTLSPDAREWRVRAALRRQNWAAVRSAIEDMPEEQQSDPAWIYWLARADKAEGSLNYAYDKFRQLRGEPHFYSNLAEEELGLPIQIPPLALPLTPGEHAAARSHPGLLRALALFRLDLRLEAVREWNWAIRDMDDRQLLAAATLAHENHIYDRAINTANRTQFQHDYRLRFLAPFAAQVRAAAREQSLDDAWVYGLMRQESRFIIQAKSTAGASGLMQLMPATARWVAKKIGLKDYNHARVNDPDTNLLLGTSYMRMVLDGLNDHPVLASAAYNAGPSRAQRWRAEVPLDATIYIETIPFDETRDYVKKVMSNTVYYAMLFTGKPTSLRARLGTITPRESMEAAELP
ncbi:MAG: lytic transglycosylase domain-containing protein [Betaproteobacteria bacterium]|nr:lytic transglycosylase domain-containing protein [Betaproteobacteria bacterium]